MVAKVMGHPYFNMIENRYY